MSIFTVCLTGMRVWVGIPGDPSAAATLALEEKENIKRERDPHAGLALASGRRTMQS